MFLEHVATYSLLTLSSSFSSLAASIEAAFAAERASKLQEAFAQFDANSDGVVSYSEFTAGLKKRLGDDLDDAIVRRLFGELDKDGNQVISSDEFELSVADMGVRMESYIREEKVRESFCRTEPAASPRAARRRSHMTLLNLGHAG